MSEREEIVKRLEDTAKNIGVATYGYGFVKVERTRSGRFMWFVNGNRSSKKDATVLISTP